MLNAKLSLCQPGTIEHDVATTALTELEAAWDAYDEEQRLERLQGRPRDWDCTPGYRTRDELIND